MEAFKMPNKQKKTKKNTRKKKFGNENNKMC